MHSVTDQNDPNNTFTVEYAKSNRSTCHGCDTSIDKDTLRLSRKNYTSKRSRRYGPTDEWYHVDCFNQMKKDLGFFGNAELFFGFVDLNNEDQVELKEKFGTSTSSKRKRKGEQCELLWTYKDNLRKEILNNVLKDLLEFNGQKPVSGESNLIDAVTDCMAFGALEPCPECNGFLVFNYTNYRCTGNITEWTKCFYSTQLPKRKSFEIPDKIKETYNML
ncbi:unnamed protein product [Rotaria sordida]|uniref:NAD(+) ADP-ribosyltransferase n=1 Tax=Rotaria sordida TaxID=392033 RepID=A0A813WWU6_9BILA|nr:unnamed protein product [Rotaria sordida]